MLNFSMNSSSMMPISFLHPKKWKLEIHRKACKWSTKEFARYVTYMWYGYWMDIDFTNILNNHTGYNTDMSPKLKYIDIICSSWSSSREQELACIHCSPLFSNLKIEWHKSNHASTFIRKIIICQLHPYSWKCFSSFLFFFLRKTNKWT